MKNNFYRFNLRIIIIMFLIFCNPKPTKSGSDNNIDKGQNLLNSDNNSQNSLDNSSSNKNDLQDLLENSDNNLQNSLDNSSSNKNDLQDLLENS
ncbi:MAG: hypothetical protein GY830_08000, partial [Bacteroidetes bacterium]|nr:hypothetical protein [Bacteroidota bacterium]